MDCNLGELAANDFQTGGPDEVTVVLKVRALTFKGRDRFVKDTAASTAPKTPADWGDLLYRPLKPPALKPPKGGTVEIMLIPYYAWANRGLSLMEVWIPLARQSDNR